MIWQFEIEFYHDNPDYWGESYSLLYSNDFELGSFDWDDKTGDYRVMLPESINKCRAANGMIWIDCRVFYDGKFKWIKALKMNYETVKSESTERILQNILFILENFR